MFEKQTPFADRLSVSVLFLTVSTFIGALAALMVGLVTFNTGFLLTNIKFLSSATFFIVTLGGFGASILGEAEKVARQVHRNEEEGEG